MHTFLLDSLASGNTVGRPNIGRSPAWSHGLQGELTPCNRCIWQYTDVACAIIYVEQSRLARVLNAVAQVPYVVAPITRHAGLIEIGYQEGVVWVCAVPGRVAALTIASAAIV